MTGALVDTGFLVALFSRRDRLRPAARSHLQAHTYALATVTPVIVEASFFLDPGGKANMLEWVLRGGLTVAEISQNAYRDIRAIILKYADRDIDFADATLVWFAGVSGCRRILTADERDFGTYRLKGNKRFELVAWQGMS